MNQQFFEMMSARSVFKCVSRPAVGLCTVLLMCATAFGQAPNPPVILGFTPETGPVGTEVIINGQNLSGTTRVTFGGVQAEFRILFSGDDLVATVPPGAVTGPVSVSTPGFEVSSTGPFTVTSAPPPEITEFSPTAGPVGTGVVITGNNLAGATSVLFNGVPATITVFGNTIAAFVPEGATTGPITVVTPGGTRASTAVFTVTVAGAPVITGVTPTSARPGATVTLSGENLDTAAAVAFNGTPADFSVFGSTVFAVVPAGATSGPIRIVTTRGTATTPTDFTVLDPRMPEITGITPTTGVAGAPVTITGTNLTGVTEVRFGGAVAAFNVVSDGEVEATVPPDAAAGPITVTTVVGTVASTEIFHVAPRITSFEPAFGPVGTPVTIRGASLTGTFVVQFGGVNASFTEISGTELRAVVPEGASSGTITIATPGGFASTATLFFLPPKITDFSPPSGLVDTQVTITGDSLLGVTAVLFGGAAATFSPVSLTALIATVPQNATSGPITVTTPAGSTTSTNSFFVGLFSDLGAAVSTSPETVSAGDFLRYNITVTNRGPLEAPGVTLTHQLPAGAQLVISPSGGDCTETGGTIRCNLGALAAGTGAEIRVSIFVPEGPYLTNVVTVATTGTDPEPKNNTVTTITALEGAPPLVTDVTLQAVSTGASLIVSWPSAATGFQLETAASLRAGAAWTPVATAPVVQDGQNRVTIPFSPGTAFYRLRRP